MPWLGSEYIYGWALEFPSGVSADVAFELTGRSALPWTKWEQLPDPQWPGLPAHDSALQIIRLADQWPCEGGDVRGLHWYGNYELDDTGREMRGSGIQSFRASIHANVPGHPWCLPGDELWIAGVPFDAAMEVFTGLVNDEGSPIYRYEYQLGGPFAQLEGEIYWLDLTAQSNDPFDPPHWRWQESGRNMVPVLCPAAANYSPGPVEWLSIGWPEGTYTDLAYDIESVFFGELYIKWSQPLEPYTPDDAFNGWDEFSVYGGRQIAADDWVCASDRPVTEVVWWGGFRDWYRPYPPERLPDGFHLTMWTDVPGDPSDPESFSHPGTVIWQAYGATYSCEFVGWDFDPRDFSGDLPGTPVATFKFTQRLASDQWFLQAAGDNVYWLGIAAVYLEGGDLQEYPWGWKTRPRDPQSTAPDDGVVSWDPTAPWPGSEYVAGGPLWYPTPADSWDLAFELVSERPMYAKWSQPSHSGGEGFDAASDLWWQEPKWQQLPDPQWPGLHAHDFQYGPTYGRITLADDWICGGGDVRDLHWWGNYVVDAAGQELRGSGVDHFHLSVHMCAGGIPWCLPGEPELYGFDVPFETAHETFTGVVNVEGSPIYSYAYDLPLPVPQAPMLHYWFDVTAVSSVASDPPLWRWQEANRSGTFLGWAPAAQKYEPPFPGSWESIAWRDETFSDLAFRVTSGPVGQGEVNKVVADDFISDGRPVEALTWFGSYLDELYSPTQPPMEPYVLDGWLIRFHHTEPDATCPPGVVPADVPTVLGVYFAPVDAVNIVGLFMADCFGHGIFMYDVDLSRCCLLCTERDPRPGADPPEPAQPGRFLETSGFQYWVGIQAVAGVTWQPGACGYEDRILTGHLPSRNTPDGHFWGWHTSPGPVGPCPPLEEACTGRIVDFSPYPAECWDYGEWVKQPWLCDEMPPFPPVNMAFDLQTFSPPDTQACCRADGTCVDVLPLECVCTLGGVPQGPGSTCEDVSPMVRQYPIGGWVCQHDRLELTVLACAIPPVSYQWYRDGQPVGGNSPLLVITDAGASDQGWYCVTVTDGTGSGITVAPVFVDVYLMADANCDDRVDNFDISPFVLALTNRALWEQIYACDYTCANDCNGDGRVDNFDITPFVACLVHSGCP